MTQNRIAIVGAGAVGSLLGGFLAKENQEVTLIGNPDHMAAIAENGLEISGVKGQFTVQVKTAVKLDFSPDLLFIALKTQDLEQVCEQIQPLASNIPIVLMQNGMRSCDIAQKFFKKELIISSILMLNARFIEPGKVFYIDAKSIVIGKTLSKNPEHLETTASFLNHLAPTRILDNITGTQWSKLLINCLGNSLDGMTGMHQGEYIQHKAVIKIGVLILKEALMLIKKNQIQLGELPGIPIKLFNFIISLPLPAATVLLTMMLKSKGDAEITTSTLQSLKKGKKTEIDYLNGEFVRLAEKCNMNAPRNQLVVDIIHEIETSGCFPTPKELAQRFSIS